MTTQHANPLPVSTVIALHDRSVQRYGGATGVRSCQALDAAIHSAWQSFAGTDLYPSIQDKAARLCYEIITQHPFLDGNKRTGALMLGIILRLNGYDFHPTVNDYITVVYKTASGKNTYNDLLEFTRKVSSPVPC